MKTKEIYFLSFTQLEGSRGANLLSIGNFAEKQCDKFIYITKNGKSKKTIEEIQSDGWRVVKREDINVKSSLWKWYKQNPTQQNKKLIFDEKLTEENSIFYNDNNFFTIPILLKVEGETLKFNLITNN
jgi:hypothetical protein